MFLIIGFMLLLVVITAVICIAERDGSADEKDYPLTPLGFMRNRTDLWIEWIEQITEWADHRKKPRKHSHSAETYDECYTTRKENHYENN